MRDARTHHDGPLAPTDRDFDCRDVAALVSGLLDDELPPETRHQAERHIAACSTCTALLDEAESLNDLVAPAIEDVSGLPGGFADAVLDQTVRLPAPPARLSRWGWTGWFAAAASLVLAATVWFVGPDGRPVERVENRVATANGDRNPVDSASSPDQATSRAPEQRQVQVNLGMPATTDGSTGHYGLQRVAVSSIADDYNLYRQRPEERPAARRPTGDESSDEDSMTVIHPNPVNSNPTMGRSDDGDAVGGTKTLGGISEPPAVHVLARDDRDTVYRVMLLLEMLSETEEDSLRTAEQMRQIAEYDGMLDKLAMARQRLDAADRAALFIAESILVRVVHGPVGLSDMREMRSMVDSYDLLGRLRGLSGDGDPDSTM